MPACCGGMNRWLAWTLDYDFIYNDSSSRSSDYYENRLTAGNRGQALTVSG